jgi:hypothetical protein
MKFRHFVVHYTPLKERKENMIKEFEKQGIKNYIFVECYDREKLTEEEFKKFEIITPSEVSLFCKQIEVIKLNQGTKDIVCMYEDDAVLIDGFLDKLNICLQQMPEDWDILFGGGCADLHMWHAYPNQYVYEAHCGRGGCFIMFHPKCLSFILEHFESCEVINEPSDHWLNKAIWKHNLKCYWTEPVFASQGSEIGIFKKSIDITAY